MGEDVSPTAAEAGEDLEPGFTLDELMDAIYQEYHVPGLGEGEFSTSMYARRHDLPWNVAQHDLEKAEKAGKIIPVGDRMADGKRSKAYRLKEHNE